MRVLHSDQTIYRIVDVVGPTHQRPNRHDKEGESAGRVLEIVIVNAGLFEMPNALIGLEKWEPREIVGGKRLLQEPAGPRRKIDVQNWLKCVELVPLHDLSLHVIFHVIVNDFIERWYAATTFQFR
jgi:hypothetical protein